MLQIVFNWKYELVQTKQIKHQSQCVVCKDTFSLREQIYERKKQSTFALVKMMAVRNCNVFFFFCKYMGCIVGKTNYHEIKNPYFD